MVASWHVFLSLPKEVTPLLRALPVLSSLLHLPRRTSHFSMRPSKGSVKLHEKKKRMKEGSPIVLSRGLEERKHLWCDWVRE